MLLSFDFICISRQKRRRVSSMIMVLDNKTLKTHFCMFFLNLFSQIQLSSKNQIKTHTMHEK